MADDVDHAHAFEELHRVVSLNNRERGLPAKGRCYNCIEPLPVARVFCDADCGDDYLMRHKNAINVSVGA